MSEQIEYYPGFGKQCDYCKCWFSNSHDMNAHLDAFGRKPHGNSAPVDDVVWRKSSFDDSEIYPADADLKLKLAVQQNGKVVINGFEYFLTENGKWLKRKRTIV
jgi:hypothetical protein